MPGVLLYRRDIGHSGILKRAFAECRIERKLRKDIVITRSISQERAIVRQSYPCLLYSRFDMLQSTTLDRGMSLDVSWVVSFYSAAFIR